MYIQLPAIFVSYIIFTSFNWDRQLANVCLVSHQVFQLRLESRAQLSRVYNTWPHRIGLRKLYFLNVFTTLFKTCQLMNSRPSSMLSFDWLHIDKYQYSNTYYSPCLDISKEKWTSDFWRNSPTFGSATTRRSKCSENTISPVVLELHTLRPVF